jgi:hypothetical protein
MVNLDLLDRALAEIDAAPESWNQSSWSTCLAAKVAIVAGVKSECPCRCTPYVINEDGDREHVRDYARRMLGIAPWYASILLSSETTRAKMGLIRDALARQEEIIRSEALVISVAG